MKITKDVSTTTTKHITILHSGLLELLTKAGFDVPSFADITIRVPGGDWYGSDLDLKNTVINVDWQE